MTRTDAFGGRPMPRLSLPTMASLDIDAEALRRLAYRSLCLFVFTVPWQGVVVLPGGATIAKGAGGLAVAIAAASLIISGRRHRLPDAGVITLVFTCWVALSFLWTQGVRLTSQRCVTMVQLAILVLLILEFGRTDRRIRGLMAAWVAGCCVVGFLVLVEAAKGVKAVRFTAPGVQPNILAFVILLGIPMAWYLSMRTERPWLVVCYRLFVCVSVLPILLTASRAALVQLPFPLLIIPLTLRRLKPLWRGALVLMTLVAGIALPLLLPSGTVARLSTTTSEVSGGTLDHRTVLWKIALDLIERHPIVGVGAGVSRRLVAATFATEKGVHNTYLSVGSELGLIGLAIFGLLLLATVWRALKAPWLERRLAFCVWLTLVLGMFGRHAEYEKSVWTMVGLVALIGVVRYRPRRPAEAPAPAAR